MNLIQITKNNLIVLKNQQIKDWMAPLKYFKAFIVFIFTTGKDWKHEEIPCTIICPESDGWL